MVNAKWQTRGSTGGTCHVTCHEISTPTHVLELKLSVFYGTCAATARTQLLSLVCQLPSFFLPSTRYYEIHRFCVSTKTRRIEFRDVENSLSCSSPTFLFCTRIPRVFWDVVTYFIPTFVLLFHHIKYILCNVIIIKYLIN